MNSFDQSTDQYEFPPMVSVPAPLEFQYIARSTMIRMSVVFEVTIIAALPEVATEVGAEVPDGDGYHVRVKPDNLSRQVTGNIIDEAGVKDLYLVTGLSRRS